MENFNSVQNGFEHHYGEYSVEKVWKTFWMKLILRQSHLNAYGGLFI